MKSTTESGFTLLELLVVVAVILIIARMLLPALDSARENARHAQCVNNIRQITLARRFYRDDHPGWLIPDRPGWPADSNGLCTWRWYVNQKYQVGRKAFLCPSIATASNETIGTEDWRTGESDFNSNYAQVAEVSGNDRYPRVAGAINFPAQQIELFETRDHWPDMHGFGAPGSWGWVWGDGLGIYGYWHRSKLNLSYYDGHVETKLLGRAITPLCEWDGTNGPHDGSVTHGEYAFMLPQYK